ncbi:unnamed protein product [Phyllotreta striolata]|uniref:TIL domain-containing protein n=1 Tax=Phyllotreta striolata TaxID=444603 RepID=A0A9P0GW47_PHYSR|nr:unnamed protein product [Phyllotreta striolata]
MQVLYGILLICGFTATALAKPPKPDYCDGRHEVLNECASSCTAEPSCNDVFPQPTGICNKMCVRRCECDVDNGYVRNFATGKCVRIDKCPANDYCDGRHEVLNECASSCIAEPSCLDPYPQPVGVCNLMCIKRCECDVDNGYVRDLDTGRCIRKDKCPATCNCGFGEVFNECASSCLAEPTCQDPTPDQEGLCTYQCVQRCECDASKGYIRDKDTDRCVLRNDCPVPCADTCGFGEVFNDCASNCLAEPTCQDPTPDHEGICTYQCVQRCECDASKGYIRDRDTGRCVLRNDCPVPCADTCGFGEVFNDCASNCLAEPTCQDPTPDHEGICTYQCVQRCECDASKGYIRDRDTGICVLRNDCPVPCADTCGFGEVFNDCASNCLAEPTCQDPTPDQEGFCTYQCVQRCECDASKGYIRDRDTGICVLRNDCPVPCAGECPDNEHIGCETCCPESVETCQNRNPKPCKKMCTTICKWGCQCDEGYIRDEISNRCVRPYQCPNYFLHHF